MWNVCVNNVHSEGVWLVLLEVFLVKDDIWILFVLRNGDEVGEDVMFLRHEWAHFDGHIFVISRFRKQGIVAAPWVFVSVMHIHVFVKNVNWIICLVIFVPQWELKTLKCCPNLQNYLLLLQIQLQTVHICQILF